MGLTWTDIATVDLEGESLQALWLGCDAALDGLSFLSINAKGAWQLGGLGTCGPEGLSGRAFPAAQLLTRTAPVGALIGKLGGGSAEIPANAAEMSEQPDVGPAPFAVGSQCIVRMPPKSNAGPLFLGLNLLFRPIAVTVLRITVSGARTGDDGAEEPADSGCSDSQAGGAAGPGTQE